MILTAEQRATFVDAETLRSWERAGVTVRAEGTVAIIEYDQPQTPVNVLSSKVGAIFSASSP